MNRRRSTILVSAVLIAVVAAAVAAWVVRRPRLTPELRGQALAEEFGCFACHGAGGRGGVPNPGSRDPEIPAWDGGTAMMYVENEGEIREWIAYGHPARLADRHAAEHDGASGEPDGGAEEHEEGADGHDGPDATAVGDPPPVEMPAYGRVLNAREIEDLVAYFKAVSAYDRLPPDAAEGYEAAARAGCFGCHGPGGLVGARNHLSFKGYIPPWRGADYAELVRDDAELRAWILDGGIPRFQGNPAARFFTERQVIRMPAYRSVLTPGEVDAVVRYIEWLNEAAP